MTGVKLTDERLAEIRERTHGGDHCAYAAADCFASDLLAHISALTAERDALKAKMANRLEDAFVAGFLVSGEGYNGEYPHEFTDGETLRKELLAQFSAWLEKSSAAPPSPIPPPQPKEDAMTKVIDGMADAIDRQVFKEGYINLGAGEWTDCARAALQYLSDHVADGDLAGALKEFDNVIVFSREEKMKCAIEHFLRALTPSAGGE